MLQPRRSGLTGAADHAPEQGMALNEREQIQFDLLKALHAAKKRVEQLEAALAHNAVFLGAGVEPEGQIGAASPDELLRPETLLRHIGLVEEEEDISNYIGREGHDESRPKLGEDAPDYIRPQKEPEVSPLVGQLALGHPADSIIFALPHLSPVSQTPEADESDLEAPPAPQAVAPNGSHAEMPPVPAPPRPEANPYAIFNGMQDGFILFEHTPVPGAESSRRAGNFFLVTMNPAFARMFSPLPPRTEGPGLTELLGRDAEEWAALLLRVLSEGLPVARSFRGADRPGLYEISAYVPEPGRVACIVKDVTEMRRIEQDIRLNEARLAALYRLSHMDAAPEARVIRYSLEQAVKLTGSAMGYLYVSSGREGDSGWLYWSHALKPLMDSSERDAERGGVPWGQDEGSREIRGAEVVNAVEGGFVEFFGRHVAVARYMLAPVIENGRTVCMAGVANKKEPYAPSDLRQLELFISGMWFQLRQRWEMQELKRAKDAAEAANKAKNEFLANVSHELRTPLHGILGMLQVLQQSSLDAELMECVNTAASSGQGLLRIISDILDFSCIEAGSFVLVPHRFDFAATVRSVLGMFAHEEKLGDVRLTVRIDEAIPKELVGDDARVRQILVNLVGNAYKFTGKGEVGVECSLLPYCRPGKRCIYFAVSDTGPGIPDSRLNDIFKSFTQLDGSSTRRYQGAGLGLAIVQRLVAMMQGALAVESEPGKGTTVHCSLPFEELSPEGRPVAAPAPGARAAHPLDLLVVEDDAVNQFTLRALLKKAGYASVCVNNGRQAIEALRLRAFECVITDIQMPVMDGMELARRIRAGNTDDCEPTADVMALLGLDPHQPHSLLAVPRDIPIVALTAHAMEGDRERCLGMGMDYYLAKPVMAAELAAVLAEVGARLREREGQ